MSDIRGIPSGTPGKASDGSYVAVHTTGYGDIYTEAAMLGYGITGRLFGAHFGTLTAPLATPATTSITARMPQAFLRVPDGTAVIPLTANVIVESAGNTTQGEVSIAMCQNDVGNGSTSVAATAGPLSLNTAAPVTSNCTPRQLATAGDVTAEVNLLELKRFSFILSAVNQDFSWAARQQYVTPILRGPATFLIYIGGNAINFFAQMQWLELPETAVTN